ncbi:MAG: F0F1 ATP synthase subunit A [Lachnospiraceae bacterium]
MNQEVDFMIHGLIPLFGGKVWITTTHVCTIIVMVTILVFAVFARRAVLKGSRDHPTGFQSFVEYLVEMLDKVVHNSMGKHAKKYVNYIGTLMLFIFLSNISGLFGLRPPTADYGTTLCLALMTFLIIQYNNLRYNKYRAFTNLFKPLPLLFPINLIGEFATPLSLSLRLFGNVMAGTIMMALWYGLLPFFVKIGVPSFLHAYFDLFSGAIQTYVFTMLTMVFVTDKIEG